MDIFTTAKYPFSIGDLYKEDQVRALILLKRAEYDGLSAIMKTVHRNQFARYGPWAWVPGFPLHGDSLKSSILLWSTELIYLTIT